MGQKVFIKGGSDVVLGLALVHHLHISDKLSFKQITELLAFTTKHYAIIEFVPISDNKVKILMKGKPLDLIEYTLDNFIISLSTRFTVTDAVTLQESERKLMFLEKKGH